MKLDRPGGKRSMRNRSSPLAQIKYPATTEQNYILTSPAAVAQTLAEPKRMARYWVILVWLGPAAGVLYLALADAAGRASYQWADLLYWLGLCFIYLPAAARVFIGGQIGRNEGLSVVLTVAFGFSLARVLAYPTGYALNDEFQHWRTLQDILATGHLYSPNPILPVSPAFPGLEILTDALIRLTGLPDFVASMFVIVLAKQLLTLALFLVFERLERSSRFATIATLIFLANPTVLYDDGQFAYETLGFALAVLSLYLLVCATSRHGAARKSYFGLAILTMAALVVTHHVSGILFAAFILLWAVLEPRYAYERGSWHIPLIATLLIIPMLVLWYAVVAQVVWWYLAPFPVQAIRELIKVVAGVGQTRMLFSHIGTPVPLWEQIATYVAVVITAGGLIVGWFVAAIRYRFSGLGWVFVLTTMTYFASLSLHFIPAGLGGATRLMGWSFIPAGFLLALDALEITGPWRRPATQEMEPSNLWSLWRDRISYLLVRLSNNHTVRARIIPWGLTLACVAILLGNISTDAGFTWFHTPGPFVMGGDARGITQEGISSATWMRATLGPGHRLATDTENSLLFATFGAQFPVTTLTAPYDPSVIFTESEYDASVQDIIAKQHLQYLVVDMRMSKSLPAGGYYFGAGGQESLHVTPLSPATLEKFSRVVGIDLVYDSGNLLIYRLR